MRIRDHFPDVLVARDEVDRLRSAGTSWSTRCVRLRDQPDLSFGFLSSVTATDHPGKDPRFWVVYELRSVEHAHRLRIKVGLPGDDPHVPVGHPALPDRRLARAGDVGPVRRRLRRPSRPRPDPAPRRLGGPSAPQGRGARRRRHAVPRRVHPARRRTDDAVMGREPRIGHEMGAARDELRGRPSPDPRPRHRRGPPGDDDHQHGAAAPLDARGAPPAPRAGRRDRHPVQADRRLPPHRHREEHGVPHVGAGRRLRHPRRLPLAVLQRARVLPGGRAAPRDRGAAPGPGPARDALRAQSDRLAPGLGRHRQHGARRGLDDALRVPRARGDPRHLRGGHRPSDEPFVHPARRRDHGSAARRPAHDREVPRHDAGSDRRLRADPERQPDLARAQRGRREALRGGCARVRRHGADPPLRRRPDRPAEGRAVQRLRDLRLRRAREDRGRRVLALRDPHRGDARVAADRRAGARAARRARSGHGRGPQGRLAGEALGRDPTASATTRRTSATSWRSRWRP